MMMVVVPAVFSLVGGEHLITKNHDGGGVACF